MDKYIEAEKENQISKIERTFIMLILKSAFFFSFYTDI